MLQPDGKLLVGGDFTNIGGVAHSYIARLNSDGSYDSSFNANLNANVFSIALQADGRIIIAGNFTAVGAGARAHLARLNADGSLDATFTADTGNTNGIATVFSLMQQADGKLLAAGGFATIAGSTRNFIARLSLPAAAVQSLSLQNGNVIWQRSGSSPELALPPTIFYSVDNSNFSLLGTMSRITGGWQLSGIHMPAVGQTFYLRAYGTLSSGFHNGSQGALQTTRQFHVDDRIFADGFE